MSYRNVNVNVKLSPVVDTGGGGGGGGEILNLVLYHRIFYVIKPLVL